MENIPTPKQLRDILKCLTPEQRKAIQARISDVFAKHRRSRFKLISSTYQKVLAEWMNRLAYRNAPAGKRIASPSRERQMRTLSLSVRVDRNSRRAAGSPALNLWRASLPVR
jgi:hypothetical protein